MNDGILNMGKAYLGLGSNLGDKEKNLRDSIEQLRVLRGVKVLCVSRFYETDPVGPPQPGYLNAAVAIDTSMGAHELLAALQEIESSYGRTRDVKWGARTIDIDILLYDNEVIEDDGLVVPHTMMEERLFVLEPLAEIAAEVRHPVLNKSIAELLASLRSSQGKVQGTQ